PRRSSLGRSPPRACTRSAIRRPSSPPYNTPVPCSAMSRNVRAKSGFRNHSPARGARPSATRYVARAPSSFRSLATSALHSAAMIGVTGNPSAAYPGAGGRGRWGGWPPGWGRAGPAGVGGGGLGGIIRGGGYAVGRGAGVGGGGGGGGGGAAANRRLESWSGATRVGSDGA